MPRNKKKILLIDDVPENVIVLKERLEKEGYDTLSAHDGRTGIKMAFSEVPDLVICDIMMPGLNGYEVLNVLHENPTTASIPFIYLTAKSDPQDVRDGMESGADDYITKPFNSKDLVKAVKIRLERKEVFNKRSEDLKNSISYSLPHELQTPLTTILGFSQILMEDHMTIKRESIRDIAADIQNSAQRLNQLVQRILFTSRLEIMLKDPDEISKARKHSSKVKDLITETSQKAAEAFARKDDLVFELDEGEAAIFESHLRDVTAELIDNALKYSPKGTEIKVIGTCGLDEYSIYIIDSGRGMPEDQISRISDFVQFQRENFEQQGTGLGLSMVKKIVSLYNGHFNVDSIAGVQTMVSITLPLAK